MDNANKTNTSENPELRQGQQPLAWPMLHSPNFLRTRAAAPLPVPVGPSAVTPGVFCIVSVVGC
ncbi:hypothetical protein EYF80_050856 [Liparis tanakae]|uniref:Uncharacterized protein n=1 Tax=Liparis tanakae TaxID=230148 RepID=A0A4Z2FDJ7_9TELE|nr:hypothetical protein EYF80_050856 [Liparis tanakae]